MDLKDFIIQEFNTLVDNLQNSFIEVLKKKLLDQDLAQNDITEKLVEDENSSLPLKRKDSNRGGSRLKKLSKIAEESQEEQYIPDISTVPQKKLKKLSKISEDIKEESEIKPQPLPKRPEEDKPRPEEAKPKAVDSKQELKKPEEERLRPNKPNSETKERHEEVKARPENKPTDMKIDPKKSEEDKIKPNKSSNDTKERAEDVKIKPESKQFEPKIEVKKPDDDRYKPIKTSIETKEKPKEFNLDTIPLKAVVQVDEKKVEKWNDYYAKIHGNKNDTELYSVLISFSKEIDDKIQEGEMKYLDKCLGLIQSLSKDSKNKQIKGFALSILSRCKEKLPKKPHISDHLESLGIKLG